MRRLIDLALCASVFVGAALACGGGTPQSSSEPTQAASKTVDLDARVNFSGTQFTVTNVSTSQVWQDIVCTLNPSGLLQNGYDLKMGSLKPGEKVSVGAMQFAKSDGTRFNPLQMKPTKMHIKATVDGQFAFYVGGWN